MRWNIIRMMMLIGMISIGSSSWFWIGATDIVYPGAPLAANPFSSGNALYPGTSPSGNTVTVNGGAPIDGDVGGAIINASTDVTDNTVTVMGASIITGTGTAIYGGRSNGGAASGNTVTINGTASTQAVIGGRTAGGGSATNNTVVIHGGTVNNNNAVRAGQTENGTAAFNTVVMDGGSVRSPISGGYSPAGVVSNNTVSLSGGAVFGAVEGGTTSALAENNRVTLMGTVTVSGQVDGARTTGSGDVVGNTIEIHDSARAQTVTGGWATGTGNARGNRAVLYGGAITSTSIDGGASNGGFAHGNVVEIWDGTVAQNVTGGRVNNGASVGSSADNQVFIYGGAIGGNVFGGRNLGLGDSASNHVSIMGGTMTNVYGGYTNSNSVGINGGRATGNTVNISGGVVTQSTYGGYGSGSGEATGNKVSISGGWFGNNIHGGFSRIGAATQNILEISGNPNLAAATLYGGLSDDSLTDIFTGNTFTTIAARGPVIGIRNFENYNFFLPASLGNGQAMWEVTGSVATDMAGTTVNLMGVEGGGEILQPGDKVMLIGKAENQSPFTAYGVPKGALLTYDMDVYTAPGLDGTTNALWAELRKKQLDPDAPIVPGGPVASLALISGGLIVNRIMEPEERRRGATIYVRTSGESYNYRRGIDLDLDAGHALVGLDWNGTSALGEFTFGTFFEAGHGKYKTRHEAGASPLSAWGNVDYAGGGVLGFLGLPANFYLEGSARAGWVGSSFKTDDLADVLGRGARYDLDHLYYGGHAGLGYMTGLGEKGSLNVATKFLWLRQGSEDGDILGENVHFHSGESQRWRTMVRYSHRVNQQLVPYVGAGYEYEFDGRLTANVHEFTIASPSFRDGNGLVELGLNYNRGPLSIDAAGRGSFGFRNGVAGWIYVGYSF